ncbi:MAG: GDP-L-fucose synthase [Chloroflexi bacterium]|nr:GDP-L-fucose synthase [Chloroflexota bacterium]MBT4072996.1 GDP-L-fucose synthase [Chloroflexota bacterium]MBT6680758.1 GDP-L-fucose synthase [Chloroflexota bacterium]
MQLDSKIYVAGHKGLAGAALVRALQSDGYTNLIMRTHAELDLTDQAATRAYLESERPDYVFLAAALVGGIHANSTMPADFISINLAIQSNVISVAHDIGVKRLLYFGSNCAYPRESDQPMKEEYLHTGHLEPTNEWFAVAKLAGMAMVDAYNTQHGTQYIAAIPAGLYGPDDNFAGDASHVIPALMRRFYEARESGDDEAVLVWGTGTPEREFLYVDDMAEACLLLMNMDDETLGEVLAQNKSVINIGTGNPVTIRQLAEAIRDQVAPGAKLEFDTSRPDGFPRKVLDPTRLAKYGWEPSVSLSDGIKRTYQWFLAALEKESLRVG